MNYINNIKQKSRKKASNLQFFINKEFLYTKLIAKLIIKTFKLSTKDILAFNRLKNSQAKFRFLSFRTLFLNPKQRRKAFAALYKASAYLNRFKFKLVTGRPRGGKHFSVPSRKMIWIIARQRCERSMKDLVEEYYDDPISAQGRAKNINLIAFFGWLKKLLAYKAALVMENARKNEEAKADFDLLQIQFEEFGKKYHLSSTKNMYKTPQCGKPWGKNGY